MSDLISRQAAIDALKEHRALYCDNTPDTFSKLSYAEKSRVDELDTAIATLVNLPSIQPEPQWIPCSERLPEEEDIYLVTFDKSCLRDDEISVTNALWIDNQWQYDVLESYEHKMPKLVIEPIEELKVIAWMPLPPSYKGEES